MSIIDTINSNTQSVIDGKLALANAITTKGGDVGEYAVTPTFNDLTEGIQDIFAITDVEGSEKVNIKANSLLTKGETCVLIRDTSAGYTGELIYTAPTSALNGSTTISKHSKLKSQMFSQGKYLLMFGTDEYAYPFYWNGTEYVQLKINNEYTYFLRGNIASDYQSSDVLTSFAAVDNGKWYITRGPGWATASLSVYSIDTESLNLTTIHSEIEIPVPWSYQGITTNLIVHNNNIWLSTQYKTDFYGNAYGPTTYQYFYDESEGTLTRIRHCLNGSGYTTTSTDTSVVFDMTYDINDNVYLYIYTDKYSCGVIRKMTLSANGQYVYDVQTPSIPVLPEEFRNTNQSSTVPITSTVKNAHLNMSFGCNNVVYINSSNEFVHCSVDLSTMSLTEVNIPFSDGLDTTKIANIALAKGSGILFIQSSDENLSDSEKVRVYAYGNGQYTFIGAVSNLLSPTVPNLTMPYCRPIELLSANAVPFLRSDGNTYIYRVGSVLKDFDYFATACNNALISLENAVGYGVVLEDISLGAVGSASFIFEGSVDEFIAASNNTAIGGAY